MHRKSIEAAEHLKDDNTNTTSDKEEEDGDHQESVSSKSELSGHSGQGADKGQEQDMRLGQGQQQGQDLRLGAQDLGAHPPPPPLTRGDPEQFRNNSIACLRAKVSQVTKVLKPII